MKKMYGNQLVKTLLLSVTIVAFSCNNQSNNQTDETQNTTTEAQEVNVKEETRQDKNLPPKPEKHTWFFEMCEYTGTYDANKNTKEQLENTLKYLINGEGTIHSFSIFTPEDLKRVNKAEVEQEFNQTLEKLRTLEFVYTPYFAEIKQERIAEVERIKLLSLIRIESFSNPEVLKNDNYSKQQCSEYTNALITGGDELLALRKKMAEQSRDEGNQGAWDRYLEETESGNQLEFARVYVSTFGWWNCVNNSIERADIYEMHTKGFLKLFEDVTEECETP